VPRYRDAFLRAAVVYYYLPRIRKCGATSEIDARDAFAGSRRSFPSLLTSGRSASRSDYRSLSEKSRGSREEATSVTSIYPPQTRLIPSAGAFAALRFSLPIRCREFRRGGSRPAINALKRD